MSANATLKGVEEAKIAGMNDYLTKPVQFNKLLQAIAIQVNLPCKVLKNKEDLDDEKLLSPIKRLSENDKEFKSTTNELIDSMKEIISSIKDERITYDAAHSMLNKAFYIGDEELINQLNLLQEVVVSKDEIKIKIELKKMITIWSSVERKVNSLINA